MDDTSNTTKRNVCSLSIALSNTEITKKLYGIFLLLPAVEWLFTLLERAYLAFNYILMYSAGLDVYMSLKVCVVVFFASVHLFRSSTTDTTNCIMEFDCMQSEHMLWTCTHTH